MKNLFLVLFFGKFKFVHLALSQPHALHVKINNRPFNSVAVGDMHGDKIILSESFVTTPSTLGELSNSLEFKLSGY